MAERTYQDMILTLERFWADQGCVLLTPYHTEVAAGTMNPATFLRSLGPSPWRTAYLEPVIRPPDVLDLYLGSLAEIGLDTARHDIRFVEDDWEQPTVGAWGLGWEVWCDGMEITQFTYFQQLGGLDLDLVPAEITYGLDRLAMLAQGKPTVFDLVWADGVTWEDVYRENERQWSHYNFEEAPVDTLTRRFGEYEEEARSLVERELPLPAYDQVLKANHAFNLLDARGAISVAERAAYIARIRDLVRDVAQLYLAQQEARAEAAA
jgi:glycyl-tRNA synthetase alpha chain